jgi:hypothetical protein
MPCARRDWLPGMHAFVHTHIMAEHACMHHVHGRACLAAVYVCSLGRKGITRSHAHEVWESDGRDRAAGLRHCLMKTSV